MAGVNGQGEENKGDGKEGEEEEEEDSKEKGVMISSSCNVEEVEGIEEGIEVEVEREGLFEG